MDFEGEVTKTKLISKYMKQALTQGYNRCLYWNTEEKLIYT